jgi:RimJ/RimL family protein N-acetyltransferase
LPALGERSVLQTERLILRQLTPADLDDMAALLGDPEVMRYYPRPKTRDEAMGWIEWNLRNYAEHGFGLWGLVLREEGTFAGDCGLTVQQVEGEAFVEVGYHVRKDLWRRGLASEAVAACRDFAFDTAGVERLIALIRPENVPSRGVAEKIGLMPWRETVRSGLRHIVYATTRDGLTRE